MPVRDNLTVSDLEYVADILKSIAIFKNEVGDVSTKTMEELDTALRVAEAALRRAVAEIKLNLSNCHQSN